MSEPEKAAELGRLREVLMEIERGTEPHGHGPGEQPRYNERELARVRARVAELEAELGL
jgi:hypothetical protein